MKTKFNEYLTKLRKFRGYTQAQMQKNWGFPGRLIPIMRMETGHRTLKYWNE